MGKSANEFSLTEIGLHAAVSNHVISKSKTRHHRQLLDVFDLHSPGEFFTLHNMFKKGNASFTSETAK